MVFPVEAGSFGVVLGTALVLARQTSCEGVVLRWAVDVVGSQMY